MHKIISPVIFIGFYLSLVAFSLPFGSTASKLMIHCIALEALQHNLKFWYWYRYERNDF